MMDGYAYARSLVEVDASLELVKEVPIILPNNEIIAQKIMYDYTPTYCGLCKCIGHREAICENKTTKQPKTTTPTTQNPKLPETSTPTAQNPPLPETTTPTAQIPPLPATKEKIPSTHTIIPSINPTLSLPSTHTLEGNVNNEGSLSDEDEPNVEENMKDDESEGNVKEGKLIHVDVEVEQHMEDTVSSLHVINVGVVSVMHSPAGNEEEEVKGFQMVTRKKKEIQRKETDEAEESARIARRKEARKEARQAARHKKYLLEKRERQRRACGMIEPIRRF